MRLTVPIAAALRFARTGIASGATQVAGAARRAAR
jgi:hypothetical protein